MARRFYRRAGVDHIVLRIWASTSHQDLDGVTEQLGRWAEVFEL